MGAKKKDAVQVTLKPLEKRNISITIEGITPLIQHKFDEKAKRQIREKKEGRKSKIREKCDPEKEFRAAMHLTENGEYGIPVDALKASIISAAHKDLGIEKTLVRKSLFIICDDANGVLKMDCSEPVMREDYVRVGTGTDLRYRPEFKKWRVTFVVHYDAGNLTPDDIVNLLNRAGFGGGIGEWRPQKGGDFGQFMVVLSG